MVLMIILMVQMALCITDEKCRPVKEMVEFPPSEVLVPNYAYRNLLFVYPKDLNFTNRPGEP